MALNSAKLDIDSFNGDINKWDEWRFTVQGVLRANGLSDLYSSIKEGTRSYDTLNTEGKSLFSKLQGILSTRLKGEAQAVIRALPESANCCEVLQALESRYNSQSLTMRLLALKRLVSDDQSDEQKIEEFICGKQNLVRERLQNTIDVNELLLISILGNVNPRYKSQAISLLSDDTCTLEKTKKTLIEAEAAGASSSESDAHARTSKTRPDDAVSDETEGTGFLVREFKKMKNQFNKLKGKGKNKNKNKTWANKDNDKNHGGGKGPVPMSERKCYKCGGMGHMARDCAN